MSRPERVRSLSEFTEACCRIRDRWTHGSYFDPWFRGQANSAWPLRPTIYRLNMAQDEHSLRDHFRRVGMQLVVELQPQTDWEWYFLMRHHRVPTRLLDWTDGALIALFFAVNDNGPDAIGVEFDAAVWVLDPWWLNKQTLREQCIVPADVESYADKADRYLSPLYEKVRPLKKLPAAIDPPHIARRLAAQRSHFTIHGTDPDGLLTVSRLKRSRLAKIIVDKDAIPTIRRDLATMGIVDTTVFPDLDGLGRELSRHFNPEALAAAPVRAR
jgi:hypothetical protein